MYSDPSPILEVDRNSFHSAVPLTRLESGCVTPDHVVSPRDQAKKVGVTRLAAFLRSVRPSALNSNFVICSRTRGDWKSQCPIVCSTFIQAGTSISSMCIVGNLSQHFNP